MATVNSTVHTLSESVPDILVISRVLECEQNSCHDAKYDERMKSALSHLELAAFDVAFASNIALRKMDTGNQ